MQEAALYEQLGEGAVRCNVCPRRCVVKPDGRGHCEVRVNRGGKMQTLIYGKCSSVAADPIEKKPVFHYCPGTMVFSIGTLGCNFRCIHCQNWQIAHASPTLGAEELTDLSPEDTVLAAQRYRCQGVAWTYNEPTIWFEYILDTAQMCKQNDLYTVMVTNGYITPEALDELGPYMDVFRVDLKGWDKETYRRLANVPDPEPVRAATVRAKKKWKMHVEVVTNVVPTINDDDEQLRKIAEWIVTELGPDTPWHVTRFIPYLELSDLEPTPTATLEHARRIGLDAGLNFVYLGNVPGHEGENTYCSNCGRLVIDRIGFSIAGINVTKGACAFCGQDLGIVSCDDEKTSTGEDFFTRELD